jgi:hypothetical protein
MKPSRISYQIFQLIPLVAFVQVLVHYVLAMNSARSPAKHPNKLRGPPL